MTSMFGGDLRPRRHMRRLLSGVAQEKHEGRNRNSMVGVTLSKRKLTTRNTDFHGFKYYFAI